MNFTPSRLDRSAERAVLKMCRHADEFAKHKFGLPGWEELVTAGSGPRKSIEQIRARYAEEDEILTRRFDSERKADDFANALLLRHLASVAKPGSREADFIAAQSLFAFALFQWHKTFLDLEPLCEVPVTSKSLGFCFMQSLDRYRAAEAVFGAEHRVMYLRAVFALQLIVDKRLRLLPRSEPETPLEASVDRSQADKQRAIAEMYALLGMLMDTPVKLAYAGCASGTDRAATDGGPTLLMSFEPIEVAIKRLERLLEKR